jgi:formylglycine-generating enzyme required for sulfatase activity
MGYFTSSQFIFFPIVDITHEEAVDFCKWRTDVATANYNDIHNIHKTSPDYTVFEFRLPTEEEWINFAPFGADTVKYPNIFKDSLVTLKINTDKLQFLQSLGSTMDKGKLEKFNKEIKKDYIFNCIRTQNEFLNLIVPYYLWSNPPNNFGIYNIIGNVSEMIDEKGIVKGGSFKDLFKDCNPNKRFAYNQPSPNLGLDVHVH